MVSICNINIENPYHSYVASDLGVYYIGDFDQVLYYAEPDIGMLGGKPVDRFNKEENSC